MKILVTGKNGQLGQSLQKIIHQVDLVNKYFFTGKDDLDFNDLDSFKKFFSKNNFDAIINCVAYTNVDQAEKEFLHAYRLNHDAVTELAKIANERNIKLIHISTDYVFDGESLNLYDEKNLTNPINIYGKSKNNGEQSILNLMSNNGLIIRTSWLYSEFGNNFLKTMLKLGIEKDNIDVVNDQIGSPTYASDLALTILDILRHETFSKNKFKTEVYHYSNIGNISWFDFAKEIFKQTNLKCKINPTSSDNFKQIAKRPKFSTLNTNKIYEMFKIKPLPWKSSLEKCIESNFSNFIYK